MVILKDSNTMKKTIFACGMLLLVAAGCSKDETAAPSESGNTVSTFTLIGEHAPETRTSIGDKQNNVYPVLWCDNDALGLFSTTEGADVENIRAGIMAESAGNSKGVFVVQDEMTLAAGETDFLIYYPYNAKAALVDGKSISAFVPAAQIQKQPNQSTHTGSYAFAYAAATSVDDTTPVNFTLKHATAYVKFTISSQQYAAYKLTGAMLYDRDTKTPLSGDCTVDLTTGEMTLGSKVQPYAEVTVSEPQPLSEKQVLWLTALPADLTGKKVYVVVTLTNDDQHTVTIPILREGKELKANCVNAIEIADLKLSDNSCDWYEPVETRLLVDGWAYGESNCEMIEATTDGNTRRISVKARGRFTEVEEPRYAKTIFNCDLNNDHKMTYVNGSPTDMGDVADDYTVEIGAYRVSGGYAGAMGQIGIYGEDGTTVLWSINVWMTPTPEEHAYKNGVVMDRNLGAFNVVDDWKSNGVYFQWGRPTPFGWGAKGFESIATEATSVRFSIENPRKLLCTETVSNTKSDWYLGAWTNSRTDRKDDLWGNPNDSNGSTNPESGRKSIYDPCPKGWRIVSPAILAEVEGAAEPDNTRNNVYALKYCYDGTNYAYWPCSGARWGSNLKGDRTATNTKTSALYWSNSPASSYTNEKDNGGRCLYYNYANKTWTYTAGRSHALSVRCMKDTENR